MNPRSLDQFLALASALHFGRAALASNTSISTLSRTIRQLENELGVALFLRDNRSVTLTSHGQLFETYARDALMRFSALKNKLSDAGGPLQGELSLYCSVTASHSILFRLLQTFRPAHPQVEIKLQTGDPEEAINRVIAGKEDVAIAANPPTLARGVVYHPLIESELVFISPSKNTEQNIPALNVNGDIDWAKVPMILSARGLARTRVDTWFKALKISPRVYAQVAGNEAIVSMVSLGLGVGVVPHIVLENSPLADNVTIVGVEPQLQSYELGLFTLHRNLSNPLVDAFWQLAQSRQSAP